MRLRNLRGHISSCSLVLPLLAASALAQTATPAAPAAQQNPPAQQSAPATPSLQLRNLPDDPHTPTPEEQAEEKAAQMRMQLTNIARAQASWGPPMSSPGQSLGLKEIGRTKTDAGTQISYQLIAKGFTPDTSLTLLRWPLNQNILRVYSGVRIDPSGTAICSVAAAPTPAPAATDAPPCTQSMKAGAPITVTTTVAKGEAVRVALVAADKKHGAAVSVVPFPIEGVDKGCKINVILGSKDAELVLIEGQGFQKDANYTLGTESFSEKHPLSVNIDPQGRFIAALTPWVPGHDAGDTVAYYQSSTCSPTVSFHWGKDAYKPE